MACDLLIALTQAQFSRPKMCLGKFPVIEATSMPAFNGTTRAMELLLTGEMIDAYRALQ